MAKRKKIITAGRLVSAIVYTVSGPRDNPKERRERMELTSIAKQISNNRASWQRLELELAANFTERDYHCVLTFDDLHLPTSREEVRKFLRKFIKDFRAHRKKRGDPFKYVYVIEQLSAEGGRLHVHMIINSVSYEDYDLIRSLWIYGDHVDIEKLDVWDDGYEAIAQYLTKEAREVGRMEQGQKTWVTSMGMKKPEIESGYISDELTLGVPKDAFILRREGPVQNGYGEYFYLKYLLPDKGKPPKKRRPPRKTKKE